MSLVKELSRGAWLHLERGSKDPDREALNFRRFGEFSLSSEIAFEKHLQRLDKVSRFFAHLNGGRIKAIIQSEKPWYAIMQR